MNDGMDLLAHWTAAFHEIIVAHVEDARERSEPWHAEELAEELAERAATDHRGAVETRDAACDLLRVLDRFDNAPVSAVNAIDRLRTALEGQ
jgi:hypothetical protein